MEKTKRPKPDKRRRRFARRVMGSDKNCGNPPEMSPSIGQAQGNGGRNSRHTFTRRKADSGAGKPKHLKTRVKIIDYLFSELEKYNPGIGKKFTFQTRVLTLYYLAKKQEFPMTLVGKQVYTRSDLVDEWLKENWQKIKRNPPPEA